MEEELAAWVETRPDWQQHVVRRFCDGEGLEPADVDEIADTLVGEKMLDVATVSAADMPGGFAVGAPVRLSQLCDVIGVNALLPDQTLNIAAHGLTVIYGDNGSGKSGYARLIREAVTARVTGDLLGNAFADENKPQQATITYVVGDSSLSWHLGGDKPRDLARIRFLDRDCRDSYVTTAGEVNYRPSALGLLDRLTAACREVQHILDERLATNIKERPALPVLHDGTAAQAFMVGLAARTSLDSIAENCLLDDDHAELLAESLDEEARLNRSDPGKERDRLERAAKSWSVLGNHVETLAEALNAEGVERLTAQRQKARDLRAAARAASSANFDAEPLEGVGADVWRTLWEAAREFSNSEAYHCHTFPNVDEGALCVLCQQPLDQQARERIGRFNDFMGDAASSAAETAEEHLSDTRVTFLGLQKQPRAVTEAIASLRTDGLDPSAVERWISEATEQTEAAVEWIDDDQKPQPVALDDTYSTWSKSASDALMADAKKIDDTTFKAKAASARQAVLELQDRQLLAAAEDDLRTEVERLAAREKISRARRLTEVGGITRKKSDLTEKYVTVHVGEHFSSEAEALNLRRVVLNRTAGRSETSLEHRAALDGVRRQVSVDDVLSEGEQTVLGLAGFLTEVELDHSKSGVVFDDPVSSLDSRRRKRVAKRLVELAKSRQVVIFTHEITFVHAINIAARHESVEVAQRTVQRMGEDHPGRLSEGFPWRVKNVAERVGTLEADVARTKKARPDMTDEVYEQWLGEWAGRLSQTWERAVHLDLVDPMISRATNEVSPSMIKVMWRFSEEDFREFRRGYSLTGEWAARHDRAPELNSEAPTIDELEDEVRRLRTWSERVRKYKDLKVEDTA